MSGGYEDLFCKLNSADDGNDNMSIYSEEFYNLADKVFVKVMEKTSNTHEIARTSPIQEEIKEADYLKNHENICELESEKYASSEFVADNIDFEELDQPIAANAYGIVFRSNEFPKLQLTRSKKWLKMYRVLSKSKASLIHCTFAWHSKFKSRVRKGIPHVWRGNAWSELVASQSGFYNHRKTEATRSFENKLIDAYYKLRDQPTPFDDDIDFHVNHTMRYHTLFYTSGKGRDTLEHLVTAVILYHPKIFLNSGLVSWLALLLTVACEEKAFLISLNLLYHPSFVKIAKYNLSSLYSDKLELAKLSFIHENLLNCLIPEVMDHLTNLEINPRSYLDIWFTSLFIETFNPITTDPFAWPGILEYTTVLRLLDLYFMYGKSILMIAAVAILDLHKNMILEMDKDTLLAFLVCNTRFKFKRRLLALEEERFISRVFKLYEVSMFRPNMEIQFKNVKRRSSWSLASSVYETDHHMFSRTTPSLSRPPKRQTIKKTVDPMKEMLDLANFRNIWPNLHKRVSPIKVKWYKGVDLANKLEIQFDQFAALVGYS